VEDRSTAGLYLELGDLDPDHYGTRRAGELLRLRGVSRVSWWGNCRPERPEFPRRVPEGRLLGVAEVDEGFVAPEAPARITARHFRRYPRPGQGVLTGRPTTGILLVWVSPKRPELARPLRDWADFVHIRHIAAAAIPGFTMITPYEHTAGQDPRFMHFYEMDCDDPEAAFSAMAGLVASRLGGERSEAFGHWADLGGAGGYIVYVNTFRLLGSRQDGER
jgi:hypothetical protein